MMNITRIFLLATIFGIALFAGFKIGKQIDPIKEILQTSLDATAMPDVPIPNNNQFNLLIIGVNDVDQPNAQLQSIWLAAFTQTSPRVTLVSIFPSSKNEHQNQLLEAAFFLEDGKPSKQFWDAMRDSDFWWKGYVISDLASTIKMINVLGGIEVNGRLVNGLQMASRIPSWKEDTNMAIEQQKVLLEGVCTRLTEAAAIDLEVFIEILLEQPQSNVRATLSITDWATMVTAYKELTCEFPTPMNPPVQPGVIQPIP